MMKFGFIAEPQPLATWNRWASPVGNETMERQNGKTGLKSISRAWRKSWSARARGCPLELIQNGWDEPGVTKVSVTLEYRGRNKACWSSRMTHRRVFKDLRHAFTLFADSAKKSNPEQRGRFQPGRKAGARYQR